MGCRRRFCRRPLPERLSMSGRAVGPQHLRQFLAVAAAKRGSPIRPPGPIWTGRRGSGGGRGRRASRDYGPDRARLPLARPEMM